LKGRDNYWDLRKKKGWKKKKVPLTEKPRVGGESSKSLRTAQQKLGIFSKKHARTSSVLRAGQGEKMII